MAVKFRDYYETMGVERTATKEEIRKAFRKLARKYHPDVAEDKSTAEAKFQELNEAYEVLGDPEKRKKYDRLGPDWEHMGNFTPPQGAADGGGGQEFHFDGTGFSDFFEQMFSQQARQRGATGGGGIPHMKMRGHDIEAEILVTLDEVMNGSERSLSIQRARGASAETVRIRIPKGVTAGKLIRCAGLGQPGVNGGESGDLFMRVQVQRHPDFVVDGHDLHCDLPVMAWDAVLGSKSTMKTPHGSVTFKIPPGTADATEMRIAGKGLPKGTGGGFGDLYVKIHIGVPEAVTESERALWENLKTESSKNHENRDL